ncbi:hypothetical protein G5714_002845 [Onychostoma macrolepis]|uniref:Uncharacterized protein n=1 Tax=Onychostoma macrolepis TaxID=369639 RepID=A0A7J6D7U0_9TELE|nr:hypothetical protein G5714_002845 [Onychostoma macrolepis]
MDYKLTTKRRHILGMSRGKVADLHNRSLSLTVVSLPNCHTAQLPEICNYKIIHFQILRTSTGSCHRFCSSQIQVARCHPEVTTWHHRSFHW